MSFIEKTLQGKSGRIFVREWNSHLTDKTPIVLIHDSLGCVELWRDFPDLLSQQTNRRVIAYDRLGFGKSDPLLQPISKEFIANEVYESFATVCEKLGISKFILLGHSVGGGMALNCASRLPDRCEAVITIAAQSFVEDKTLAGILAAKSAFQNPKQIERLEKYHGNKTQWVLDSWINTWTSHDFANWSLADVVSDINASLLVIHGLNDEYGSDKHPKSIANLTSGQSTLILMEETAHFPHREKPEDVLKHIHQFLESLQD
jgi:pimeloyl-ACP methyl ester carboxylesterase